MSDKIIIVVSLGLSLCFVLMQNHNVHVMRDEALSHISTMKTMEKYIWHSFGYQQKGDENIVFDLSQQFLSSSNCVIYLPQGVCRSCFTALLLALQDDGYSYSNVVVLAEKDDFEIKSECSNKKIKYSVSGTNVDSDGAIVISRLYRGFLPIVTRYSLGDDSILHCFLSDDEMLIYEK